MFHQSANILIRYSAPKRRHPVPCTFGDYFNNTLIGHIAIMPKPYVVGKVRPESSRTIGLVAPSAVAGKDLSTL